MNKNGYRRTIIDFAVKTARKIPFIRAQINKELQKAKKGLDEDVNRNRNDKTYKIPEKGLPEEVIRQKLAKWHARDHEFYKDKKISGCLYYKDDEKTHKLAAEIAKDYLYQNPLHFDLFPAVAQMEAEVISMVKNLYNGDENACGILTSGGTESIMMSMLAYREWGRARGITEPEIVAPVTAHIAFGKAAFYYGMKVVWVPIDYKTGMVNVKKMKRAINSNTVCLVGSVPNYPYGTYDPIGALAGLAEKYGIGLHVDCCLGGFVVPFAEAAGVKLPIFDFRCKNVTTISVDPHKYGLAPKGVSVALFRNRDLRAGAIFSSSNWPGGIYATPTHAGSRGGGPSVGAWVAMMTTGIEGYKEKAVKIIQGTKRAIDQLREIKDLDIVGNPEIGVINFISKNPKVSAFEIVDRLSKKGWHASTLQYPPGVHLSITSYNLGELDDFVAAVKACVNDILANPNSKKGSLAQLYGSAMTLPESIVDEGAKLIIDAILGI